jgi:DNA-binding SARP family transcriptional activator
MEFRILGPLEVLDDGRPVPIDRRLSRALLAYLLLHANEPVSSERLVDQLWGEKPPKTAVASLQNYVSRLRKSIGRERLRLEPAGYVLRVDPERFDLSRFDRLVAEAKTAPAKERAEVLRAAISLWRGEPLVDLAFEEFAQAEIAQLSERLLTAIENRIAAELELGAGPQLVDELEGLIAAHPLRERLRGQLMLALYRGGRQADALDAYRDARRMLQDELGLEPSDELRSLQRRILEQDPALFGAEAVPAPVESRRTVTVLFCDVVDSTRLAVTLDPEAYRRLLSSYYEATKRAVETHGGTVEKFIGDAVTALFGIPDLHEDDALRAVRAAVDVRRAIQKLESEPPLRVRIAVNTGEVVTSVETDRPRVTGAAINVAAHLEKRAGASEIVLGDATHALVRDAVRARAVELGKGLHAYRLEELSADRPMSHRRYATLVGRKRELRRLRTSLQRASRERTCAVVTVTGEAGIGKTRLAREFVAAAEEDAQVVVGRCVAYGAGATYMPIAEVVRQVAPEPSAAGVASLLANEDDAEQVAQRIAEVVGFAEGPAAPGESFWAVRRLLEGLAREQTLVVVLDDLHWAEPTLLDLVEYLGEWGDGSIVVLCLARQELLESRPSWGGPTSTGLLVELEPLDPHDVTALVDELAGGTVAPDVLEGIVNRAGGNPLFAEQLLALATEAPEVSLAETPPSVEALIAARLDRLELRELEVLRRASVLGRLFTRSDLEDLEPVADADLRRLERRALVHPMETKGRFRFHHVLVRDVAYRGIAKGERAKLHERVATNLDRRDGADEIIGYHLEQAYRLRAAIGRAGQHERELATSAGHRLGSAGTRAWRRGDVSAATNLIERATSLVATDDQCRSELLCTLATAAWLAERDGARALYEAAIDAARDRRSELYARMDYAYFRVFSDPDRGVEELLDLTAEAVPMFEELPDDMYAARAWLHRAAVQGGILGCYRASLEAAEAATDHVLRAGEQPASSLTSIAVALAYGPTPAREGIRRCDELLQGATVGGGAGVRLFSGSLFAMRGEFEEARLRVQSAANAWTELGWTMRARTDVAPIAAEIELLAGDIPQATIVLRENCKSLLETSSRAHDRWHLSTQSAQLARLLFEAGNVDEAESWLAVADRSAARVDVSAQIWRGIAAAEIAAGSGDLDRAEALARRSFDESTKTDAPNDRAAAALALAKVLGASREATGLIRDAVALYEQKENSVGASRGRALLAESPVA